FTQQIDGNPAYRSSQSTLSLDLVTNLWYLDEEGLAALWARAQTRPLGQLTVKHLGSNDLLLYLIAYSVVHRGHLSPSFFTDLRLLIEKGITRLAYDCHGGDPLASQDSSVLRPAPVGIVTRNDRHSFYRAPTARAIKQSRTGTGISVPTISDIPATSRTWALSLVDHTTVRAQARLVSPHPFPLIALPGLSLWVCQCAAPLVHQNQQVVPPSTSGKHLDRACADPARL
ncbi:MAG: hypothetical protein ABIU05_02510, partial [Nitrospirales bacterium]